MRLAELMVYKTENPNRGLCHHDDGFLCECRFEYLKKHQELLNDKYETPKLD